LNPNSGCCAQEYWNAESICRIADVQTDLREAVKTGKETRVMYFQPYELVEQLIDEAADIPGALPLLSLP